MPLSKIFAATSADVTFISSDNTVFKIHSTYLNSGSAGFATPQKLDGSEPVQLLEPANVLEILFQFIEPPTEARGYRQPSIAEIEQSLFFQVAEAAEKYVVYSAMSNCMTHMRQLAPGKPVEVLNHCTKHGYTDLADVAASHSIGISLSTIAVSIHSPDVLRRWGCEMTSSILGRSSALNRNIFSSSHTCFDERLSEDSKVNRLEDSFLLFREICSSKLLAKATMVLFLNKCDLLKRKLRSGMQVKNYLPSFGSRPNELATVIKFMGRLCRWDETLIRYAGDLDLREKFREVLKEHSPEQRWSYFYATSVIDTEATATTISAVRDSILQNYLKKADFV
ncbi:hypothetical protein BDN70DRAFT_925056 [Pholiota conissans]|uniref:BTB domain-containing protein n=1 Tax=Pholiota conissans TaxID=109636 RepID=A0A9P5YTK0_9AGAR|nr:hypothetical protein BDN70DRAFT_925056 [Pholiota conissans]